MDFKARRDHEIILSVFLDHLYAKDLLPFCLMYIQLLASGGYLDSPAGGVGGVPALFQPGELGLKAVTAPFLEVGSEGFSPSSLHRSRRHDLLEQGESFRSSKSSTQGQDQDWDQD